MVRRLLIPLTLLVALFLADQASKWWLIEALFNPSVPAGTGHDAVAVVPFFSWLFSLSLERVAFVQIPVLPFFNLVMVWNEGVSFGLMSDQAFISQTLFMLPLLAIVAGLSVWLLRTRDAALRATLAVIIGGALGNLWDRVRFGAVADFFDFHLGGWHYPAFNIADALIVLGLLVLIARELFLVTSHPPSSGDAV